jgi:type IV pilus assembly protein PilW
MAEIHVMNTTRRCRSGGFSLVEILVAVAVGLIATVAIFQVFAVFEGQKRTTTSGGEAQTSGTLALFTLEREMRQAGYGINNVDFLGCGVNGWDEQAGGGTALTLSFVPVVITQGAGSTPGVAGAPDTLSLAYSSGDLLPSAANISQNMLAPDSVFQVSNRYGFREGDLLVAAETGKPCTLAQASKLPVTLGDKDKIEHDSGTYTDPVSGAPKPTRYNKPGGLGVSYTTNGKLFNLGASPVIKGYSVQDGQLLVAAMGTPAAPIYDGIVQLQAQYGKDINSDGVVDLYDEATPTTSAEWAQVLAVRIALVARSGLYEKDEVSPATIRLWDDSAAAPTTTGPVWTLSADERHYRYKVFQTVVPLRNMIWRPK